MLLEPSLAVTAAAPPVSAAPACTLVPRIEPIKVVSRAAVSKVETAQAKNPWTVSRK